MIYLVTTQQELFDSDDYQIITAKESLNMMEKWKVVQLDTETGGKDARLCGVKCAQFGNDAFNARIVVDASTTDIRIYKHILERKLCILQNGKFDLKFLFNYGIILRKIYDTMIVEQLLHLGWPSGKIGYSLADIAWRRLKIHIDKSIRGEIIWRGLDTAVIKYAAGDVTYLERIMQSQIEDLRRQGLLIASHIECNAVAALAYLEWCGIHLDEARWRNKMAIDQQNLDRSIEALNSFVTSNPQYRRFTYVDTQGDLFSGFDLEPRCTIQWSSSQQVTEFAKFLGFDTKVQDKETGEDKDSVMEKHLKKQKGINDEFLRLYFGKGDPDDADYYPGYNGSFKVVSSFGQGHINAINPKTDRIHTTYKQLGAASGRMSCGSQQSNTDLAEYKKISASKCTYPNIQQLPHDELTRSCFTAPEGYEWCSCDYSAIESRLGADIYNEKSMLDEFLHGSGDMHSLCAYMVYKNEIPRDTPIKDIKKKFKHLRSAVKPIEFSQQFGGSEFAIQNSMGCSLEEAKEFKEAYDTGFPGIADFKRKGSEFVRKHGYIIMCQYSGHKMYWWDHDEWLQRQQSFTSEFWEDYRLHHKGTNDSVARMVSAHFKAASKYDRMALNAPTQGSGAVIIKMAITDFFNWVVDNGYFGKIELAAIVHDEINIIYPKELHDTVPQKLKECMEKAAAVICKKLPIPAEAEIAPYWKH